MSAVPVSAKEDILRRIREALPGVPMEPAASHSLISRAYTRSGALSHEQVIELFVDRLIDYDTEIFSLDSLRGDVGIADAVAQALQRKGETSVLASAEFPNRWLPGHILVVRDRTIEAPLTTPQIDAVPAVITTCEVAVAATGTIFLVHEGAQGRRALTLLPDHHICLVRRNQIVESIPEAITLIAPHGRKPITSISGPSATSDIEMTRIRGVHGPRRLSMILYG
jgi:L-lactate dehydrogenase complex protein LldG